MNKVIDRILSRCEEMPKRPGPRKKPWEKLPCLRWNGAYSSGVTPSIRVFESSKPVRRVILQEIAQGPMPKNWRAVCVCNEPECVRPEHIVLLSAREYVNWIHVHHITRARKVLAGISGAQKRANITPHDVVQQIKRLAAAGVNAVEIHKATGVSYTTAYNIASQKRHKRDHPKDMVGNWKAEPPTERALASSSVFRLGALFQGA